MDLDRLEEYWSHKCVPLNTADVDGLWGETEGRLSGETQSKPRNDNEKKELV